jgi:hypothetical protein
MFFLSKSISHHWSFHKVCDPRNRVTRYRTRHFFNVMSTAIAGEVWRPTSAEQVQHLGLVEETGNQGDFIGRAYRRSSKNECQARSQVGHPIYIYVCDM